MSKTGKDSVPVRLQDTFHLHSMLYRIPEDIGNWVSWMLINWDYNWADHIL